MKKLLRFVLILVALPSLALAAVQITDGTDNVNVDSNGNLTVNTPTTSSQAGYVKIADNTGDHIEVMARDNTNTLLIGRPVPVFYDPIESTALDNRKWTQPASTMTITQVANAITLNGGSATASGNVARITTWQQFPLYSVVGCGAYWTFRFSSAALPTNQVTEMGLVLHTSTTAPTSGAYFQATTAGVFQAVRTFNSIDQTQAVTLTNPQQTHTAKIVRGLSSVTFSLDDVQVASFDVTGSSTANGINDSQVLPFSARIYNSGVASLGNQLIMGPVTVFCDTDDVMNYGARMTRMGGMAHAANANNSTSRTGAQNPNWSNSAAPASASLSNTAASYTTLGGQFQWAATATNETDWALFAWQNSVGNTLYVTSIDADLCVTGAATASATGFFWAVATSSTAVSLATADSAGTGVLGPRRTPLFSMGHVAVTNPVTCLGPRNRTFEPPLVIEPTRFLHIIVKTLGQAATASLVYRGHVAVHGYTGP